MPDIDYGKIFEGLKDSVISTVKGSAKEFLDQNADAQAFLADRAKRVAELGVEYVKASSDEEREGVKLLFEVVQQSIRNELAAVAIGAEIKAKETFGKIMETAIGVVIKAIPVLLSVI